MARLGGRVGRVGSLAASQRREKPSHRAVSRGALGARQGANRKARLKARRQSLADGTTKRRVAGPGERRRGAGGREPAESRAARDARPARAQTRNAANRRLLDVNFDASAGRQSAMPGSCGGRRCEGGVSEGWRAGAAFEACPSSPREIGTASRSGAGARHPARSASRN
jgi:hypothetical protein